MRRFFLLTMLLMCIPAMSQIRPVKRSPSATQMIKTSCGNAVVWFDPAKWKHLLERPGLEVFSNSLVTRIEVISDPKPMTTSEVKKAFLAELQSSYPNLRTIDSESRAVPGGDILFTEVTYRDNQLPMLVLSGFYGGPAGSLRVVLRTVRHLPNAGRTQYNELLAGIEIR